MAEEEEGVVPLQSYDDLDIATIIVDINCEKLVQSLDPVSFALNLVYRHLIASQQSRDILKDRNKTRSERNLAFLNLIKFSSDPTWFSALLETLGEDKTTERLKEVLEKSELVWSLECCHVRKYITCSVLSNGAECSSSNLVLATGYRAVESERRGGLSRVSQTTSSATSGEHPHLLQHGVSTYTALHTHCGGCMVTVAHCYAVYAGVCCHAVTIH